MDLSTVENILRETIGLNISSIGKTSLQNAVNVRKRFLAIKDDFKYFSHLESSVDEINSLVEEVTVNETWFFRDTKPFSAMLSFARSWFTDNKYLSRQNNFDTTPYTGPKLKILSIPCATGEEPYSLAITLLEAGFNEKTFQIDAVDINGKSLKIAEKAVYSDNSFRGTEGLYYKEKYFTKSAGKYYSLQKEFQKNITFSKDNLLNPTFINKNTNYHIIFCRNLLIYFDPPSQKVSIDTLDALLAPGGILFVGHAEHGVFSGSQFVPSSYPKTFSLVRKIDKEDETNNVSQIPDSFTSDLDSKDVRSIIEYDSDAFHVDEIVEARLHLENKEYDQAVKLCKKHIELNGPTSTAFFWFGNILDAKGEREEAINLLKKSIYYDPENIDAMVLLCSIYSNIGDKTSLLSMKSRLKRVRTRLKTLRHSQ